MCLEPVYRIRFIKHSLCALVLCVCVRAGMKSGDIVVEVNGVKVNTSEEIYNAVRTSDSINMVVRRGQDLLMLHMTPEFTE